MKITCSFANWKPDFQFAKLGGFVLLKNAFGAFCYAG